MATAAKKRMPTHTNIDKVPLVKLPINVHAPEHRREERVTKMQSKGHNRKEAEKIVDTVITTKEQPAAVNTGEGARVYVTKSGEAHFEQGMVSFVVDSKDLNRVVGCNGESCPLDRLMDSEIVTLAQANNLPVQPYARELLTPVLKGVLQNTWYRDIEQHESDHLRDNQQARVAHYLFELKRYREPAAEGSKSSRSGRAAGAPRKQGVRASMLSKSFQVVNKDAKNVASGREAALLSVLLTFKGGETMAAIVEAAKDKVKTKQDFEKTIARFLKELIEHGAVAEVKE
jgi:hypothetical protein